MCQSNVLRILHGRRSSRHVVAPVIQLHIAPAVDASLPSLLSCKFLRLLERPVFLAIAIMPRLFAQNTRLQATGRASRLRAFLGSLA